MKREREEERKGESGTAAGSRYASEGGKLGLGVFERKEVRSFRESSALIGVCRVRGQRSFRIGQVGRAAGWEIGRGAKWAVREGIGGLRVLDWLRRVVY
jgi:hypothetical protein